MADIPKWASVEISAELPEILEAGESDTVEFKKDFPEQKHKLAEEIAAMASSGGGRIFIGINNNGEIKGLSLKTDEDRDDDLERAHGVVRLVKPIPEVDLLYAVESDKIVLVIDIPKQKEPVYYYDGRPYIRDKRCKRKAEPDEVKELVWAKGSPEYIKKREEQQEQANQLIIDSSRQKLKERVQMFEGASGKSPAKK